MYLKRHKSEWWVEPKLTTKRLKIPAKLRDLDPVNNGDDHLYSRKRTTGSFNPSRKWVAYNRLQAIDAGYIAPLYDLTAIAKRFGLSHAGRRYYRKHILPEPYDIIRRGSLSAHHWSRIVLMVLDIVLKDLEDRGELRILARFEDHVQLIQNGVAFLEDYYADLSLYEDVKVTDKHGVQWLE